jgi:DNA-binding transcriptional MerR regulator
MLYTMADLERLAGVSARTIREYIRLNYLQPPTGHGPGATYTEEQMLAAVCVARMRARGVGWDEIAGQVPGWSTAKLRAYVKKTDPVAAKPDPPPPQASSPLDPPALEGEPVAPRRRLPHGHGDKLDHDAAALPEGPRWVLVPLLPGMALMVRDDAAAVVRRAAAEIIERYGTLG